MRRPVIIYIICTICALTFIRLWPGFYSHITHMNKEDLKWAANRYTGECFYFQDEAGRLDSATITKVHIYNSLNPINRGALWNSYHAYISINYVLFHYQGEEIEGSMIMKKEKNFSPVNFVGELGNLFCGGYYSPIPLGLNEIRIGEYNLTDCVLFDMNNSDIHNRPDVLINNPLVSFAWSKQYGLVQYTFQDGTEFNRIDLE